MELTATGGGSFLKLAPSGITLSGATIKMNSAGSGSGLALQSPTAPTLADSDKLGAVTTPAQPNPPMEKHSA